MHGAERAAIMAVRSISEELTCPVCQDEFKDPRNLPCGHVYCLTCIIQLSQASVPFHCPECRNGISLPSNDPDQLPKAVLAFRMKEKLQKQAGTEQLCSEHEEEPIQLYCINCRCTVCSKCAVSNHREHDYQHVEVVAQNFAKNVNDKKAALEKQRDALLHSREANGLAVIEVRERETRIRETINTSFDELMQILQRRRDTLLTEASACMNSSAKLSALENLERLLNENIMQLDSIMETADDILRNTSSTRLIECHDEVINTIDKKLEECSKLDIQPRVDLPNVSVDVNCANELAALASAQCRIISETSEVSLSTVSGVQSTIDVLCPSTVTVNTSKETQCTGREAEVSVDFKHVTNQGKCDVYEKSSGVFEFSYCGMTRGQHRLHVEVYGKPVLGSPFSVLVTLPPNQLGKLVRVIKPVCNPNSMAISSNDIIIVNEAGSNPQLVVMDRFGRNLLIVKCKEIIIPNGIAVDKDDVIYVTDAGSNSLLKFDKCGNLMRQTGCLGVKSGQFFCPAEVAVVNEEFLYVSDSGNHRIQVFDKNLNFHHEFGTYGSKLGEFNWPGDLVYSKMNRELFIADSKNHRIQVFRLDGIPIREFGGAGFFSGRAKLICPLNICLDKTEKFLLIADIEEGRILVFTTQGKYVSSFSSKGTGKAQLQQPTRVAMDSDGYVYVCDGKNNKIIVF